MRIETIVGELNVEDVGKGPVVVAWHSFLHHGGMWRAQIEALRANHRLLNIDAPGHGRSGRLVRPIDLDECAVAVEQVLDACGVQRAAAMIGLSWGGMVAFAVALRPRRRLDAIAVFDTSCRSEPTKNRLEHQVLGRVFRRLGAVPALMDRVEKLMFCDATLARNREVVDDWRSYVARMDRPSVWNALHCIDHRRDRTEELTRIAIPTLVAVGEEDRAQPPSQSDVIAAAIPNARLARIPGAGHLSALERPHEVTKLLVDFLVSTRANVTSTRA